MKTNQLVALKRVLPGEQQAYGGVTWQDFRREATILSRIRHPHIVQCYGVEECPEHGPQVVMEYLNGMDLEQATAHSARTLRDFLRVAVQTLSALDTAHRMQLLHRDIKPANLQVTWLPDGQFDTKFVDFGLARFFSRPRRQTVRQDGNVIGSVYFMAPEQFDRKLLDQRTDLYSLGCVFYYILTTHRPFVGATVYEVMDGHLYGQPAGLAGYRPDLPPAIGTWLSRMMARNAADRPASAAQALAELRAAMAGIHEVLPDPAPLPQPLHLVPRAREISSLKFPVWAAAAAACILAGTWAISRDPAHQPRGKAQPVLPGVIDGSLATTGELPPPLDRVSPTKASGPAAVISANSKNSR